FALHRELEQAQLVERLAQQRVRGDDACDSRSGGTAQTGPERDALLDRELDAEVELELAHHAENRHAGRVALGFLRQLRARARNAGDMNLAIGYSARRDAIADRLKAVAEHIEPDRDIADARRCKRCRDFTHI